MAIIEFYAVNFRKKTTIVSDLLSLNFDTLTSIHRASTLMWKLEQQRAKIESELTSAIGGEEKENQEKGDEQIIAEESIRDGVVPSEFEYLLGMALWTLSAEKIEELKQQLKQKTEEIDVLQRQTPEDLWESDLCALEAALNEQV